MTCMSSAMKRDRSSSGCRPRAGHSRRRGVAAVAMVVFLLLAMLIMTGMIMRGARHHDLTVYRIESVRAYYAAEAAANIALREIMLDEDIDGDDVIGGIGQLSLVGGDWSLTTGQPLNAGDGMLANVTKGSNDGLLTLTASASTLRVHRKFEFNVTSPRTDYVGLTAYYYDIGQVIMSVDDVDWSATPDAMARVRDLNWPVTSNSNPFWIGGPNNFYAARFVGWLDIPESGTWTFETESDSGSVLYINGELVVDNDGSHQMEAQSGTIDLYSGWHEFEVRYFANQVEHGLIVRWQSPTGIQREVIPRAALAYTSDQLHQPMPLLVVRDQFTMSGQGPSHHCIVDAYDSAEGPYDAGSTIDVVASTNATTSGAVELERATIYGDMYVGVGGDPDTVVNLQQHGNITGTTTANTVAITTPQIIVPTTLPASTGDESMSSGTHVYDEDFRHDNWTISGSAAVQVTGQIVGRIDGDLLLEDDARINIAAGGAMTLYVFGDLIVDDDAAINASGEAPERLFVHVLSAGGARDVQISERAVVYGHVINPEGGLRLTGANPKPHGRLFGTFFGQEVDMANRTRIHVDQRSAGPYGPGHSYPIVTEWLEVGR